MTMKMVHVILNIGYILFELSFIALFWCVELGWNKMGKGGWEWIGCGEEVKEVRDRPWGGRRERCRAAV